MNIVAALFLLTALPPPEDVATADSTIKALYDCISGPAGPRDWDRFRALFAPGARLMPLGVDALGPGKNRLAVLSVEDFVEGSGAALKDMGFYEQETSRKVETSGPVLHAWSGYESRRAKDEAPFTRGTNSIQLVDDGTRWWIVTVLWDQRHPPVKSEGSLEVFFVDVMGGAATLLVTPEGESVLVDSGWPGLDGRDPKRIAHVLKDVAGLDHLDHLVTTHWHTDHYGGVEGLAKLVRIDNYWDRGLPDPMATDSPRPGDPLMAAYLKASEGKRKALKPGDALGLKGALQAKVLASSGAVLGDGEKSTDAPLNPLCAAAPPDQPLDPSDNARSLVLKFTFGAFDFLDCGDLTWNVEKRLVCPTNLVGPIDLFQVTHHGLLTSNHPTLLETIAPTVAIMNNGPRKGGSPETVERLSAVKSIVAAYQLHKNVATGPEKNAAPELIANPSPEGGQFVRVTVPSGGKTFSVRFGADGPAREFPTR